MNQLFSLDGSLFRFLNKFCDMLILSILWLVFSFPLLTIGASSSALYHTTQKVIVNNEGYVFSTFWKSFRTNLKQGILLTILCIPIGFFSIISFLFANQLPKGNFLAYLYFAIALLTGLMFFILATYSFPILSRFYMKTLDIIKASIALAVTRFGFTILLIAILIICALTFYLIPASGFILPACYALAAGPLLEPGFKKALEALHNNTDNETCD